MNKKEINELRRRWKPDKNAVSRVYGCFVNSAKEIVSDLDESLGVPPQEEADSEERHLLMGLRSSALKDAKARSAFYRKVIDSLDIDLL